MQIYTIYLVTNTISGTKYIGFTGKTLPERIATHQYRCSAGIKSKLYYSVRKNGWEKFTFETIYQSTDGQHCLNVMEPHFIEEYNTFEEGYNLTLGGEGTVGYWTNDNRKKQGEFISSMWTEERRIKNGLMAKERMTGIPKKESHKENMRGKRPHIKQNAGKNNNAKAIETPYGTFDSLKTAWIELNEKGIKLSYKQIYDRLNTKPNWKYIMKENI
jgi:hypothetical protein